MRFVIVEDDVLIGLALRQSLLEIGHEVCAVAPDRLSAYAAIKRHKPEGGYEVFAQGVAVPPKAQRSVTFDYLLPPALSKGDAYRLTWVRQVGTGRDRLRAVIDGRPSQVDAGRRSMVVERSLA